MTSPVMSVVTIKYGTYLVPIKLEEEILKQFRIVQCIDLLPSARKSHFDSTWGKYKMEQTKKTKTKKKK